MTAKDKTAEDYIQKHSKYRSGLEKLRDLLLKTELQETIKWGIPTYTINGKNVVGLGAFKNHFGLWFFNGVFLKNKAGLLVNAQEGKTKGMRQLRFESVDDINDEVVLEYVKEAIQNQKQGKEIKPEKKPLIVPEILKEALAQESELTSAWDSLSPGKRKEYAEYINEAKRAETKTSRLEKIRPMIMEGMGLNDKYK